jgi:hypothetical protein
VCVKSKLDALAYVRMFNVNAIGSAEKDKRDDAFSIFPEAGLIEGEYDLPDAA